MSDQILKDPRAGWAMALCSGDCNSAWLLSDLWFLDGEIICDDCLHEADCFDDRLARAQPFIGPDKNRIAELEAENARLRGALTPSADTKTAFIGEFTFAVERSDSLGSRYSEEQLVPWSTIKEIMGAINRRALNPTSAGDE